MLMEVQRLLSTDQALGRFLKSVETTVLFGHVDLADPGIMINEDDSLGLGVGDCSTIMRHGFIG